VCSLDIDCIVNSADEGLSGGGSLDHKIHKLGGPSLSEECLLHDGCPFGMAVITRGYLLPQKYIIHSPAPYQNDAQLIASCYHSSLELAKLHKIRVLAFPCIGAGAKHFPLDAHAQIVLQTIRRWLETGENRTLIDRIIFSFWRPEEHLYYTKWMPSVFPLASTLTFGQAALQGNQEVALQFWAHNMMRMNPWIRTEDDSSEEDITVSDDELESKPLNNNLGVCPRCGYTAPVLPLSTCTHEFCEECLTDYFAYIGESDYPISCPVKNCTKNISLEDVSKYATTQDRAKIREFARIWKEFNDEEGAPEEDDSPPLKKSKPSPDCTVDSEILPDQDQQKDE